MGPQPGVATCRGNPGLGYASSSDLFRAPPYSGGRAEFQLHPGIDDKFPSTSSRTTVDSPRPTVVKVTKH
jgi:hypothetical protein